MIYSLNGILIHADTQSAVIECGGVGYKCTVTSKTLGQLPELNGKVRLYTYMSIREDAVDLFGFASEDEMSAFKLLITVNGVGPKVAIAILSELTSSKLALAISTGNAKALTNAQGVGNKIAQRIVLELKDKFKGVSADGGDNDTANQISDFSADNGSQAVAALVNLGYSQSEAQSAVAKTDTTKSVEDIIKTALKYLF